MQGRLLVFQESSPVLHVREPDRFAEKLTVCSAALVCFGGLVFEKACVECTKKGQRGI